MKPLFTPEDFASVNGFWSRTEIATFVNAIIEKVGTPVFLHEFNGSDPKRKWNIMDADFGYSTHKALLIGIEPVAGERAKLLGFEIKVDVDTPPDEFHMVTGDGKRHVFKLK